MSATENHKATITRVPNDEANHVLTAALADPEGQALVQGILDRKQGLLSP